MRDHRSAAGALCALILMVIVSLGIALLLPPGGQFITDNGVKYLQLRALPEHGRLSIGSADEPFSAIRPEFSGKLIIERSGNYYGAYPTIYTAMLVPLYWISGDYSISILGALSLVLIVISSQITLRYLHIQGNIVLIMLVMASTPMIFYVYTLWEHLPALTFLSLAILFWVRRSWLASGVCVAITSQLRPESLLFVVGFIVVGVCTEHRFEILGWGIRFVAGCLVASLPFMLQNYLVSGSVVGAQSAFAAEAQAQHLWQSITTSPGKILEGLNAHVVPFARVRWLVGFAVVAGVLTILRLRKTAQSRPDWLLNLIPVCVVVSIALTSNGLARAAAGESLVFAGHDILSAFPLGVAAFSTLRRWRSDPSVRFLWTLVACDVLLSVALIPVDAAGGWGPRYLLPVYLPLAILAIRSFSDARTAAARASLVALLATSVLVQCAGLVSLHTRQTTLARVTTALHRLEPPVALTGIWYLAEIGAPALGRLELRGITDLAQLDEATADLKEFWWIWLDDQPGAPAWMAIAQLLRSYQIGHQQELPAVRFAPVETTSIPTTNIKATRYRRQAS